MYATNNSVNSANSFKIITHIEQASEFLRLWAVDDSEIRTSPQGPQQDATPHELSAKVEACLNRLSPLLIQTLPPDPSRLVAGSLCFAIIDGRLYRVRLLSAPKSDVTRVVVQLIDYGYEETVSHSDLRSHDSDILNCPPLATAYYLDCFKLLRPLGFDELSELKKKILFKKKLVRTKACEGDLNLIDVVTDYAVTLVELLVNQHLGYRVTISEMHHSILGKASPSAAAPSASGQPPQELMPIDNRLPITHPPPVRNLAQSRLYKFQSQQPTQPLPSGGMAAISLQPSFIPAPAGGYHTNLLTLSSNTAQLPSFRQPVQQPLLQPTYCETKAKENCTSSALLAIGSTHEAYVTAVNDGPYQFTIQLKTDLEETMPRLKQVLARRPPVAITTPLIPGSMVMGQSLTDKTFRRAVVSKVESDSCILYYVDYGTSERLPSSQIFKLQSEAAEYAAALGLQFRLAELKSLNITDKDKEYFKRVVLNKRALIIVKDSDAGAGFLCQYCDMLVDGENVRDALENWKIPLHFAPQFPPPEREIRVTVSHVDSPTTFYVQYESDLSTLQTIQRAVQKYCNAQSPVADASEVVIGSAVAALYPEDGSWYRSMVVDFSNDTFTVFYVDYGNRCDVQLKDIRKLNRDLVTKWRSQAVECCLTGFDMLRHDLKTAELMEETTLGKFFNMKLYTILNVTRLKVDLTDQNGGSVADFMKQEYDKLTSSSNSNPPPVTNLPKLEESIDEGFSSYQKKKDYGDEDRSVSSGSSHKSSAFGEFQGRKSAGKRRNENGGFGNKGGKSQYQENRYQRPTERAGQNRQQQPTQSSSSYRRNNYSEHDDRTHEDYNGGGGGGGEDRGGGGYGRKPYGGGNRGGDDASADNGYRSKFSDNRGSRFSQDSDRSRGGAGRYNSGGSDYSGSKFGGGGGGGGRRDFGDRRGGDDRGDRRGGDDRGDRRGGYRGNDGGDSSYQRKPRFDNNPANSYSNGVTTTDNDSAWDAGGDASAGNGWSNDSAPQAASGWGDDSAPPASTTAKSSHPVVMEFPKRELDGAEYSVLLAHLEAPDVAYVQMADCESILADIRAEIDADVEAESRQCSSIKKGSPVLAVFDDDSLLYRAIVRDSSKPEVLYVDYGNSAAVLKTQIYTITPKLAEKPPQAIRVVFSDVIGPPGGGTEWSSSFDLDAYTNHYGADVLTLRVDKLKIIDNEMVVYGSLMRSDGVDVATALVDNHLASFVSKSGLSRQTSQDTSHQQSSNNAVEKITAQISQLTVAVAEPPKRASPIDSLDLLKEQYLYAQLEYKFKFDNLLKLKLKDAENKVVIAKCANCNIEPGSDVIMYVQNVTDGILLVKLYDSDGVSTEGQISALCPAPVFRRKERVYLSSIEGPIVYYQKVSDQSRLSKLSNDLYEFYANSVESGKTTWTAGEICCAKSYDGNWYRAEIVEGPDVTVRYLDFGNIETVSVDCVRELDKLFITNQPAIAVMASMAITWKTEDVGPLMDGQELEAFMIYEDHMWLVDFKSLDGTRFVDTLVQRKLALKHADDLFEKNRLPSSWQFTPGSSVQIFVTHVDSPDLFWVHLTSDLSDIDALQEALTDVAEEGPMGTIFAAKYSDEAWYRAVNDGEEKVRFIDYGNCDVPLEKRPLKCDKLKRPERGYAVKLRLSARPIYGQWCDDAVSLFGGFIENEQIEAVVLKSDVDIVVDLKSGNELLSEKLIRQGYAAHWDYENPLIRSPSKSFFSDISSLKSFHVQEEAVTADLDSLREKFNEAGSFAEMSDVKLNRMVAAKFPDDDLWYRAIITSVTDSSVKRAYFIDFGNSSDVTEVRQLPEDLATFAPCSIHCCLNVTDEQNTTENRDKLDEIGGGGAVPVNVIFRDTKIPRWTSMETEEGKNVLVDCLGLEESHDRPDDKGEPKKHVDESGDSKQNDASGREGSGGDDSKDPTSEPEKSAEEAVETEKTVEEPVAETEEIVKDSASVEETEKAAKGDASETENTIGEDVSITEKEKIVEEDVSVVETEKTVEDDAPVTQTEKTVEKDASVVETEENLEENVTVEESEERLVPAACQEDVEEPPPVEQLGADQPSVREENEKETQSTIEHSESVQKQPAEDSALETSVDSLSGELSCLRSGQCKITLINSSEDLYIQDLEKASILNEITQNLNVEAPPLLEPKSGDHGFIIHETIPKRVSIVSIDPPSVFFYDYGNVSTEITLSDIRTLPQSFASVEPLAILCSLGYDLTPSETDRFKSLFDDDLVVDYELNVKSTPPTVNLTLNGVDVKTKLFDDATTPANSSFQRKREPLPVKTVEQIRAEAKPRVFEKTGRMSPLLSRRQSLDLAEKLLPGCVTGISE